MHKKILRVEIVAVLTYVFYIWVKTVGIYSSMPVEETQTVSVRTEDSETETKSGKSDEAESQPMETGVGEQENDMGNSEPEKEISIRDPWARRYSYYLKIMDLGYAAFAYHDGEVEFDGYPIHVPVVSIPENEQREERINRIMVDRYLQLLPLTTDEGLHDMMIPKVTYRSDRYLCFRYMPMAYLPENCDHGDLYFTLDLEKERWVEYPAVHREDEGRPPAEYSDLYKTIQGYIGADENTEISVTYQSEKWLSFVYVTDSDGNPGNKRSGVTIDLESGERVMLDDLFETNRLADWMCVNGIEEWNNGSYLYEGRLVVMRSWPLTDEEIPLPELYEYLKVDPWYD